MPRIARLSLVACVLAAVLLASGSLPAQAEGVTPKPNPCHLTASIDKDHTNIEVAGQKALSLVVHTVGRAKDTDDGAHGVHSVGCRITEATQTTSPEVPRRMLLLSAWTEAKDWPPGAHQFSFPEGAVNLEKARDMRDAFIRTGDVFDEHTIQVELLTMAIDQEGCVATDRLTISWPRLFSPDTKPGVVPRDDWTTRLVQPAPDRHCVLTVALTGGAILSRFEDLTARADITATDDADCLPVDATVTFAALIFTHGNPPETAVVFLPNVAASTEREVTFETSGDPHHPSTRLSKDQVIAAFDATADQDLETTPEGRKMMATLLLIRNGLSIAVNADARDACACFASDSGFIKP